MAIDIKPNRANTLAEAHQRVRSPLERLRKYIRGYVGLEGIAVFFLYLALWFWIGLAIDYGLFRAFKVDWVQELPWGLRCGVLVILLSGLLAAVTTKVILRLFKEFRDAALALVLERRFPKLLGDRLITAVELADTRRAEAQGYSAALVQETIHEAAERVDQLPIKQVFDWRRLIRRAGLVVLLTAGLYALVGAGFGAIDRFKNNQTVGHGFSDLNYVSSIWFERNILLRNTLWPRRVHLEILNYADNTSVAEGVNPPPLQVRAYKYVVAGAPAPQTVEAYHAWLLQSGQKLAAVDAASATFATLASQGNALESTGALLQGLTAVASQAAVLVNAKEAAQKFAREPAENWRPLTWFDLTPDLYGDTVPQVALPESWEPLNPAAGLTLDEIELKLEAEEARAGQNPLSGDTYTTLRTILDRIHERANDPSMRRKLRELVLPDKVTLIYKGRTMSTEDTFQKSAGNTYIGDFHQLRESVTYVVTAEDYSTTRRRLTVVKAPVLESLTRAEWRPAYLYYRADPQGKDPMVLRGKKQRFFEAEPISVQTEVSLIEVPSGTDIELTGASTKPLKRITMQPYEEEGKAGASQPRSRKSTLVGTPPQLQSDGRTFRTRFDNVREPQSFELVFTDTDNIVGKHRVLITPKDDSAPQVRDFKPDEVIRQVAGGYYMVTVSARIPFRGKVVDDHGLTGVGYRYRIHRKNLVARQTAAEVAGKAASLAFPNLLGSLVCLAGVQQVAKATEENEDRGEEKYLPVISFQRELDQHLAREARNGKDGHASELDFLPLPTVLDRLAQVQSDPYRQRFNLFEIAPDRWNNASAPVSTDFPLWKLGLKVEDDRHAQPTYEMELRLEAEDTDVENGVEKGRHKITRTLDKITFLVVPEEKLLSEIAKEEDDLLNKREVGMKDVYDRISKAEAKLSQAYLDLTAQGLKPEKLGPIIIRAEQINEVLEAAQRDVRAVHTAYQRIVQEEKTNQVDERYVQHLQKNVVGPLGEAEQLFEQAREAVKRFRAPMDDTSLVPPQERITRALAQGEPAKEAIRTLLTRLKQVLSSMQGMTDINKLVQLLKDINEQEEMEYIKIKQIKEKIADSLFPPDSAPSPKKK